MLRSACEPKQCGYALQTPIFLSLVTETHNFNLTNIFIAAHMVLKDPDTTSGDLATLVDVGGIFGAIAAGLVADLTKSSALTCAVWLVFSIPMVGCNNTQKSNIYNTESI